MKKVMLSMIAIVLASSIFFSCSEEEVKPVDGTKTESNPNAWK